jgi:Anp1
VYTQGFLSWHLQAPDPSKNMTAEDEAYRRGVLARSRNFLLAEALRDEGWVLWLDVDIVQVRPPCSSPVIRQCCNSGAVPRCEHQALHLTRRRMTAVGMDVWNPIQELSVQLLPQHLLRCIALLVVHTWAQTSTARHQQHAWGDTVYLLYSQYPADLIQQLLATGADIATANCVYLDDQGAPTGRTCDEGAWAETPESRAYTAKLAPDVPLFEAYPCE